MLVSIETVYPPSESMHDIQVGVCFFEDLDQTASLRVLYIKARVQSFFKVKTKTDQTLGCADGFEHLLCAHDNLYPAHSYTYYGLLC